MARRSGSGCSVRCGSRRPTNCEPRSASCSRCAGLPTRLDGDLAIDAIMAAMERDKKQTAKGLGFVLAAAPGEVSHGHSVDPGAVRAAVEELADG